jgi:hypothetical protein
LLTFERLNVQTTAGTAAMTAWGWRARGCVSRV